MTFNLPTYRNSFHLGWLLLLVPPLAALYVTWPNDNPPEFVTVVLRLFLAAVAVVPLLWLRSAPVAGRSQRLLKELRTLLPGCLIALIVPGLLALGLGRESVQEHAEWAVMAFGFGCLLMGACAFGSEFEQRTLAGLLGQPLPRGVLYLEKLGTLGLLLAFATVNLVLTLWLTPGLQYSLGDAATALLIPVFAFCSAPLFSLLSRSTLAAMTFTFTVPLILWLGATLTLQTVRRFLPLGVSSEAGLPWLLWIGTPVYLMATSALGWRVFQRLEIRDGGAGGRSNTGLHPLSWPVDAMIGRFFPAAGGTVQLVRKELRLHVIPWLVAGIMVGFWLLWLTLRHYTQDEELRGLLNGVSGMTIFAGLLGSVIASGAGAACVAEERELGTLEWQLTQPVSVRRQWLVKVAVTSVLGVVLGVLLPALLVWLGFSREQLAGTFDDANAHVASAYAGVCLLLFTMSIYASSVARNTTTALATAVGIGAGFAGVIGMMVLACRATLDGAMSTLSEQWGPADVPPPAWAPSTALVEGISTGFVAVTIVMFVATLLWLGGRNCRRMVVPTRDVARQLAGVTLALLLVLGVFGAVMVHLVVLAQQASLAEGNRLRQASEAERQQLQQAMKDKAMLMKRDYALDDVREMLASGNVAPAIYKRFGVPTNATPEVLLDAVLTKEGPSAFYAIERLLYPDGHPRILRVRGKPLSNTFSMDPILAKRYGLGSAGATTTSEPKPLTPMDRYRMDPVLARRYGLIPKGSAAETEPRTNLPAASTNPPVFKMDPGLMKRYGLQPRPSP